MKCWIFGVALLLRVPLVFWGAAHVPPTADGKFYHVVAQRIAEGQGYTWLWPDGAVTYAAHYPVGYPALLAFVYTLLGPRPWGAMLLSALLGALSAVLVVAPSRALVQASPWAPHAERAAWAAGFSVALSPALIAYTPALMTEGPVAAAGALALALAQGARERPGVLRFAALGITLGLATLLRPQSVLLAPVLGWLATKQGPALRRLATTAGVVGLTFCTVLPWTLRNCVRMERCLLVSANGGWNLLIGTYPEGQGAWVPIDGERVPPACREVFQEAAKDACFGEAGRDRIAKAPLGWLALLPLKWRATFDHTGASANHFHEAGAVGERGRLLLGAVEIASQRLLYGAEALGLYLWARRRGARRGRYRVAAFLPEALLSIALVGFLGVSAWLGWLGTCGLAVLCLGARPGVAFGFALAAVLMTGLVHGVFFGAGRYALPLVVWTAPWLALTVAARGELLTRPLGAGDTT